MKGTRSMVWPLAACLATGLVVGVAQPAGAEPQGVRQFEPAKTGNEARYRVREQLLRVNFPSDAIGVTSAITGGITFDAAGKIIPAQSRFVVDITGLKSDSDTRDRIVQSRTLETAKYPTVEIAVNDLPGFQPPTAATGEMKFQLVGDLTVHGVTKPATWQVIATPKEGGLTGTATTSFKFGDFGMTPPTGMSVLTVEDLIKLEYDFFLIPKK